MKVSELEGALLDYWVAKAMGYETIDVPPDADGKNAGTALVPPGLVASGWQFPPKGAVGNLVPKFSTEWEHGGPIIERDQIFISPPHDVHRSNLDANGKPKGVWQSYENWQATVSARTRTFSNGPDDPAMLVGGRVGRGEGPTPLIAAMRAKVASHYRDEVPDL
jgi:hypothetical protein